jgi:hypothetical protein
LCLRKRLNRAVLSRPEKFSCFFKFFWRERFFQTAGAFRAQRLCTVHLQHCGTHMQTANEPDFRALKKAKKTGGAKTRKGVQIEGFTLTAQQYQRFCQLGERMKLRGERIQQIRISVQIQKNNCVFFFFFFFFFFFSNCTQIPPRLTLSYMRAFGHTDLWK